MRVRLLILVALACAAAPSAAQAKRVWSVVPDVATRTQAPPHPRPLAITANLPYNGGDVLHSNRTHLIFWQPAGSGLTFDPGYIAAIEQFMKRVAADSHRTTNVYSVSGQYYDTRGRAAYASTYAGAVLATDRLPRNGCHEPLLTSPGWGVCMTDDQLEAELEHVVALHHLPNALQDVYFLVTPNGLGSCEDASSQACALGGSATGYCGYHFTTPQEIVYAVIPYNAIPGHCQSNNPRPNGTADPTLSTISHEHNEMVTDPFGDGWIDQSSTEDGDLCLADFGPNLGGAGTSAYNEVIGGGHYYLQEEWSNFDRGCAPRARPDSLSASGPLNARTGQRVAFSAQGSSAPGPINAFQWFFRDGHSASGRQVTHRFARPGTYQVLVRGTDRWENFVYTAHEVRVG
jgi:PKD domain